MKRTQARQVRGRMIDAQAGRFSEADRRVSMRRSVTRISFRCLLRQRPKDDGSCYLLLPATYVGTRAGKSSGPAGQHSGQVQVKLRAGRAVAVLWFQLGLEFEW